MRISKTIQKKLDGKLKNNILHWAQQFGEVVWLDSNGYQQNYETYQAILAVDALTSIKTDAKGGFDQLQEYQTLTNDWIFGYLTYDLKNDLENLSSKNFDGLDFPELYFFQPKKIFLFFENSIELHYLRMVDDEIETDWEKISNYKVSDNQDIVSQNIKIRLRTSKDSYFRKVAELLRHIERGDIYEANFCQEFFSENSNINPIKTFIHLNEISCTPFASFLKLEDYYVLSASPERYLKREGEIVFSQPIKGTSKRFEDPVKDKEALEILQKDPKERSENIMITDLVRNDLSRFAEKGSVSVEELCRIYTFKQVHQMISTISCRVPREMSSVEIIKNTFPMGSMTGAPKISAMKIIDKLEDAKRGLYSGAVGYFDARSNFDFNVVIRSILYNQKKQYVSFSVGGAITAQSQIEKEYEECLVKAKAMREP